MSLLTISLSKMQGKGIFAFKYALSILRNERISGTFSFTFNTIVFCIRHFSHISLNQQLVWIELKSHCDFHKLTTRELDKRSRSRHCSEGVEIASWTTSRWRSAIRRLSEKAGLEVNIIGERGKRVLVQYPFI